MNKTAYPTISFKCGLCGKVKTERSFQFRYRKKHSKSGLMFCGAECYHQYAKNNKYSYNRKDKIVVNCGTCGKEIRLTPSRYRQRLKRSKVLFCSKSCSLKYYHKMGWMPSPKGRRLPPLSKERIELLRKSHLGVPSPCRGQVRLWLRKPLSEKYGTLRKQIMERSEYKEWRRKVFERDNYTCQICKDKNGNGHTVKFEAHHIKPFVTYIKLRFDVDNGVTLCRDCHNLTKKKKQ